MDRIEDVIFQKCEAFFAHLQGMPHAKHWTFSSHEVQIQAVGFTYLFDYNSCITCFIFQTCTKVKVMRLS